MQENICLHYVSVYLSELTVIYHDLIQNVTQ